MRIIFTLQYRPNRYPAQEENPRKHKIQATRQHHGPFAALDLSDGPPRKNRCS